MIMTPENLDIVYGELVQKEGMCTDASPDVY